MAIGRRRLQPAMLACVPLVAAGWCSAATTLVNSAGFESPTFATGPLEGQGQWLVAPSSGATTATVVDDANAPGGSRSLRLDRGASSDRFWAELVSGAPAGRYVSIDWDMLVEATGAASGFGPFFGVNVFDDTNGIQLVASLGVDATTGDVLVQEEGTGFLIPTATVVEDTWRHYRLELDFENDTYTAFLDGTPLVTEGFVDDGLFGEIDSFSDVDIVAFAAGGDAASQAMTGRAFVDNFLVRDGIRGDYNNNGVVDAADYTVWRDNLGATDFGNIADGNADGVVDTDDYLLWVGEFGDSNALAPPSAAIPEPAALLLVIAVTTFCGARTARGLRSVVSR